jgi:hypothetical protein
MYVTFQEMQGSPCRRLQPCGGPDLAVHRRTQTKHWPGREPIVKSAQARTEGRNLLQATNERLGPDDREDLQDRRNPAVQLDKEPAIIVRKPDATLEPAPQDIQLMSEHRVLSFKPQLRLEWEGQDGQNETEPPDHSTNLGDSIAPSTPLGFLVHTTASMFAATIAHRQLLLGSSLSLATRSQRSNSHSERQPNIIFGHRHSGGFGANEVTQLGKLDSRAKCVGSWEPMKY